MHVVISFSQCLASGESSGLSRLTGRHPDRGYSVIIGRRHGYGRGHGPSANSTRQHGVSLAPWHLAATVVVSIHYAGRGTLLDLLDTGIVPLLSASDSLSVYILLSRGALDARNIWER